MERAYYSESIKNFLREDPDSILGQLVRQSDFAVEQTQRESWLFQIYNLKRELAGKSGAIYLDFRFREWVSELMPF